MDLNKNVSKLKVGMKVKSDFHSDECDIIRTITNIEKNDSYGSKYVASVDGGDPCPCCGVTKGSKISHVDAAWFIPI